MNKHIQNYNFGKIEECFEEKFVAQSRYIYPEIESDGEPSLKEDNKEDVLKLNIQKIST
jgi:hypothetical protein